MPNTPPCKFIVGIEFFKPLCLLLDLSRSHRNCPALLDELWLGVGIRRCLSLFQSGRDFLQDLSDLWVARPLPAKKSTKVGREVFRSSFEQFSVLVSILEKSKDIPGARLHLVLFNQEQELSIRLLGFFDPLFCPLHPRHNILLVIYF